MHPMLTISPLGCRDTVEEWQVKMTKGGLWYLIFSAMTVVWNTVTSNQISFILNTQNSEANAHLQSKMTQGTDKSSHESILIKKSTLRCSLTFTGKAKQLHYNPRTARDALGLLRMCTSFKHRARNSLLHQIMSCGSCQISPSRSGSGLITNLENVIIWVKQTTSSGCLMPSAFKERGGHVRLWTHSVRARCPIPECVLQWENRVIQRQTAPRTEVHK